MSYSMAGTSIVRGRCETACQTVHAIDQGKPLPWVTPVWDRKDSRGRALHSSGRELRDGLRVFAVGVSGPMKWLSRQITRAKNASGK
jgi:hypothetical protein